MLYSRPKYSKQICRIFIDIYLPRAIQTFHYGYSELTTSPLFFKFYVDHKSLHWYGCSRAYAGLTGQQFSFKIVSWATTHSIKIVFPSLEKEFVSSLKDSIERPFESTGEQPLGPVKEQLEKIREVRQKHAHFK